MLSCVNLQNMIRVKRNLTANETLNFIILKSFGGNKSKCSFLAYSRPYYRQNYHFSSMIIKLFSCSTQLSMIFFLLINVKMPTIVGILTFISGKNSIICLSEPKSDFFNIIILVGF